MTKKINLPVGDIKPKKPRKINAALQANVDRVKRGEILPGGGRPKGSRNKFAESFFLDMQTAWETQGKAVIDKVIATKPTEFLKVAASILPKELILNEGDHALDKLLDKMEEHELRDFVAAIRSLRAPSDGTESKSQGTAKEIRTQPNSVH